MHSTLFISVQTDTLVRVLLLGFIGFLVSMLLTPIYTTIAYRGQWWKKMRSEGMGGIATPVYQKLHAEKHKRNIPTMAGIIFVVTTIIVTVVFNLARSETWLPVAAFAGAGLIGLIDDMMNIRSNGKGVAGMRTKPKIFLYSAVGLLGGWWFFAKLNVTTLYIPYAHNIHVGWLVIPIFWIVVFATANAVNMSDGMDGLAGGLLVSSFIIYALIAGIEGKYDLAGFCLTVVGALLSYTWFNINPARFFMGDVGAFALGTALGVIAMQTNTIYVLPFVGAVYFMELGSVVINRTSRKLRHGKKVFLSSPIHYHFQAMGWPETKVTMRFWILGQVAGVIGLAVFLIGRYV